MPQSMLIISVRPQSIPIQFCISNNGSAIKMDAGLMKSRCFAIVWNSLSVESQHWVPAKYTGDVIHVEAALQVENV